jgi:hypothetical protein
VSRDSFGVSRDRGSRGYEVARYEVARYEVARYDVERAEVEPLVVVGRRRRALVELSDDFVGLGEAMLLVLREDARLALVDVEDPARALHELRVDALGLLDLRGQPDRVAFIASSRAVDDPDAHGESI